MLPGIPWWMIGLLYALYAAPVVATIWLRWKQLDATVERLCGDNQDWALIIQFLSPPLAVALAISGMTAGGNKTLLGDIGWIAGTGFTIVLALSLPSLWRWFKSRRASTTPAVPDADATGVAPVTEEQLSKLQETRFAWALVTGGLTLAAGFATNGALSGSANTPFHAITASLVFSLVGIVLVTIAVAAVCLAPVFKSKVNGKQFSLYGKIKDGNPTAAILTAGLAINLSLGMQSALSGHFDGWGAGLSATFWVWLTLTGLQLVGSLIIDHFFDTKNTVSTMVEHNRANAAFIMTVIMLCMTLGVANLPIG